MRRYLAVCKSCEHCFNGICAVARNTFADSPCDRFVERLPEPWKRGLETPERRPEAAVWPTRPI